MSASLTDYKYVMDSIHDLIPVDRRLFCLIDTPQFQRLRSIKQLGTCYFCFPTATHTRFSHSLGTSHLAGRVFDQLIANNPDLDLRPRDRLILQAAALLHDVGHGPFSHVFENEVVPRLTGNHNWNHEDQGLRLIDTMIDDNHIDLFDTGDIRLIKGMITGELPAEYSCLRQIVSNKDFGIDVDRMDYMQRDCYSVGLNCGYNTSVLTTYMRLNDCQLSFHVKRKAEVFQFFHTRYSLYKQIYNHHITKAVEYMLVDAMLDANPVLQIERAIQDPELYLSLNDSILDRIRWADGCHQAKSILKRIERRQFYKLVDTYSTPPTPNQLSQVEDPIVQEVVLNYGLGGKNPLTCVPFYDDNSSSPFYLGDNECDLLLPSKFEERSFRVFTKK